MHQQVADPSLFSSLSASSPAVAYCERSTGHRWVVVPVRDRGSATICARCLVLRCPTTTIRRRAFGHRWERTDLRCALPIGHPGIHRPTEG